MISLDSGLANKEWNFNLLKNGLEQCGFSLGGNWDYDGGHFDRPLDGEKQTVWLRVPFQVVHGQLDPDAPEPGTRVKSGTPFVLRHLYNEGDDHSARFHVFGGLGNQFQEPVDPDADVPQFYVSQAEMVLKEAEGILL